VPPDGPFDLVLCRNLAFTYFDEPVQHQVAASPSCAPVACSSSGSTSGSLMV
jgi:hypothetical protein